LAPEVALYGNEISMIRIFELTDEVRLPTVKGHANFSIINALAKNHSRPDYKTLIGEES
jgi:uncharacterized protein YggU (UPF0235/DUF167 family)